MNISSMRITNFKGIANLEVKLNRQFTVLIGDNATGKTSILDALSVAMGGFLLGIEGVLSRTIRQDEIRLVTIDGQPRPQENVKIEAVGSVWKEKEISWERHISKRKTTYKGARSVSSIAQKMLSLSRTPREDRAEDEEVVFPLLAYHGTGRLWAEHEAIRFQKQIEGVQRAYNNCLSPKSSSKDFLEWFKTQDYNVLKFELPLDRDHLLAFKETIESLIPDARWANVSFDAKKDMMAGFFIESTGDKNFLCLNQLSDGFRNLIGLAADLVYRCIQLNPQLGRDVVRRTPGIVLIDELDLHLHPKWQRRVVEDLKRLFPAIQFVATTHSPFIVQSLKADELVDLSAETDGHASAAVDFSVEPNLLPLSKVATEVMRVDNIRSDDFDRRFSLAREKLSRIGSEVGHLSLSDYISVKTVVDDLLIDETNDPEYKAYLIAKKEIQGGKA